jgi:hypothetical protein
MANENREREQAVCANSSCDCPVSQDDKYCSPHCETAPESEIVCGCGHADCVSGEVGAARA